MMWRLTLWGLGLCTVAMVAWLVLFQNGSETGFEDGPDRGRMQLRALLGEPLDGGYQQAEAGRALVFPEDHRAHPGFRNEWWYLTGNLRQPGVEGRSFGFQYTLFRFALAPPAATPPANPWLVPQLYMAHFAITDVDGDSHRASERFSRQGPGLAGAEMREDQLQLWLANWKIRSQSSELLPFELSVDDSGQQMGLNLYAQSIKPRVLQGDAGLSQKNAEGGASYYYSYPRIKASGTLRWEGRNYPVEGLAWFDHEWSSNSLADYQAGWDWFSLQLDDGRELVYYRFRHRDGSDGLSHLTLIDQQGVPLRLPAEVLNLKVEDWWRSDNGVQYPSRWRLRIADQGLDLQIAPRVADQRMDLSVRYWEGAVVVTGSHQGLGYVELAGYE